MGQLVFQATLGGQVNLVGPNTASTYNINVPAVAGNMVTTGDTGTVTNTMLAGSIANAKLTNSSVTIGSTSVSLGATAATVAGLTLTNPTINGFTGDTSVINVGSGQFYKDTSGNVGIGTSSPGTTLDVQGTVAGNFYQNLYNGSSNSAAQTLYVAKSFGASGVQFGQQKSTANGVINLLDSAALVFGTGNTERARIDSSGNVGIGTTSPGGKLGISGTGPVTFRINDTNTNSWDITNNSYLSFTRGSTETMRIDSSGNLLVGATATINLAKMLVSFTNASNGFYLDETSNSSGTQYIRFSQSGTQTGQITRVLQTSAVNYGTSSDYRLKENIAPMTGALQTVARLKPVTYTWKDCGVESDGFIAHELAEVFPQAVVGEKDAVNEDGSINPQAIDTSFLVATLTAAIQEQQAIIEQLRADVETLKAK